MNLKITDDKIGQEDTIVGKVLSLNKGEHFYNVTIKLINGKDINIKLKDDGEILRIDKIYQFIIVYATKKETIILVNKKFNLIEEIWPIEEVYNIFSHFYPCISINFKLVQTSIEVYLQKIQNKIILDIVKSLYEKNRILFLIHPAALKMHHNYYGGLSYHTLNMLKMADIFLKLYSYLNTDLLYAGIILHDMAKINEIDEIAKRYTNSGLLLGHLIMMNNEIMQTAILLNYQNYEEVLILQHIIISHHGLLQFGALQKPKIGEALLVWHLDTIDSQLTVVGEYLAKTSKGDFTEPIPVVNKNIFYNPKI